MHSKASFVFWLTLALYLLTLFTVTYVGVYLTYIALPLLVISGLIMKCTKPKPEVQKVYDDSKSAATQALLGTSESPRVHRRPVCLSQATLPDSFKLS